MIESGYKPAEEKPYIQLICHPYEYKTSINTKITIDVMEKDLSRDDMLEVCENFMKAMGYHFDYNEHLTIEVEPQ